MAQLSIVDIINIYLHVTLMSSWLFYERTQILNLISVNYYHPCVVVRYLSVFF